MRIRVFSTAIVVACALAVAPVLTVTNGRPDGNGHPYVGIMLQAAPGGGFFVCSGSALSPTKFLTAAHCADPTLPVLVSYNSHSPFLVAVGTFHPDPDWCIGCGSGLQGFDSHDVAVVVLNTALNPGQFATLPAPNLVDALPTKSDVDVVGYGVQGFIHGGGRPEEIFLATRYFAPSQLIQSNNLASAEFLKLTANLAQGKGGICFGDSGGPNVLAGTHIVLGVNSFVTNGNCAGVTYSQRVDLADILAFINSF